MGAARDRLRPEAIEDLESRLKALNPAAPVLRAVQGQIDPAGLLYTRSCGTWA